MSDSRHRPVVIATRLTEEEAEAVREAAEEYGLPVSAFVREVLIAEVTEEDDDED